MKKQKKHEYIDIEVHRLCVLPQVRKIANTRIKELADDIRVNDTIHAISVARLDYEEFQKHIEFINQLWHKNIKIEDYTSYDDLYYVVIAGHSRLAAIKLVEKEDGIEQEWEVKIHHVKTSREILSLQLGENIHEAINQERRAIAIVETYRFGLMNGEWKTKEEFIKQHKNKFSSKVLNEALTFAELPRNIQEYIFSGLIFYKVGVELGKLQPLVKKYLISKLGGEENLDKVKLATAIELYYGELQMKLYDTKSVKRGLDILKGCQNQMEDHFKDPGEVQQEMLEEFFMTYEMQSTMFIKDLLRRYRETKLTLSCKAFDDFRTLLFTDEQLTGIDNTSTSSAVTTLQHQYVTDYYTDDTLNRIEQKIKQKQRKQIR